MVLTSLHLCPPLDLIELSFLPYVLTSLDFQKPALRFLSISLSCSLLSPYGPRILSWILFSLQLIYSAQSHLQGWPLVTPSPARISLSLELQSQIWISVGMCRPERITPSPGITCSPPRTFFPWNIPIIFPDPCYTCPQSWVSFWIFIYVYSQLWEITVDHLVLHYRFQSSAVVFGRPICSVLFPFTVSVVLLRWEDIDRRLSFSERTITLRLNVTEKDSLTLQKSPALSYFLCFASKKEIIPAAEIISYEAKNVFLKKNTQTFNSYNNFMKVSHPLCSIIINNVVFPSKYNSYPSARRLRTFIWHHFPV